MIKRFISSSSSFFRTLCPGHPFTGIGLGFYLSWFQYCFQVRLDLFSGDLMFWSIYFDFYLDFNIVFKSVLFCFQETWCFDLLWMIFMRWLCSKEQVKWIWRNDLCSNERVNWKPSWLSQPVGLMRVLGPHTKAQVWPSQERSKWTHPRARCGSGEPGLSYNGRPTSWRKHFDMPDPHRSSTGTP